MKYYILLLVTLFVLSGCGTKEKSYLVTKEDLALNVTNCFDGVEPVYITLKKSGCITFYDTLDEKCQVTFYKDQRGLIMRTTKMG